MALDSYSGLVSAIGDWLDRDDLASRAPDFIRLTEVRLNRLLDDPDMEVVNTAVAVGETTALPADFGSLVSISDNMGRPLQAMGSIEFAGIDRTIGGQPRFYVIEDNSINFAPSDATATIRLVYRRTIPPLTEVAPTNWLLERAPDLYLYGALMQAEAFLAEDDRVSGWKASFDEAIAELRVDGLKRKWGPGPIAPRIRRP